MRKRDTEQDIDNDDIDINVLTSAGILGETLTNVQIKFKNCLVLHSVFIPKLKAVPHDYCG